MSLARADNGMDPYTVLGISARAVRGKSDLYKLRSRCKTMIDNYTIKRQGGNARRVKWAFDQIKLKVSQDSKERAAAAAAGAAAAAAPEAGPVPEAPAPDEPPVDRLDAIRNKAAARRERAAAGKEDPETAKRQDSIRERLAVKRMLKQVPVLKEEECKQKVVKLLEAPPPGAGPAPERVRLTCPASGARLQMPGRGRDCQHLQCFDVDHHLNGKSSRCPVCSIELELPSGIFVDGYVTKILTAAGEKVKEVTFDRHGVWTAARDRPAKATAAKAGAKSSRAAARPAPEAAVVAGAAAVPAAVAAPAAPAAAAAASGGAAPREKRPREAAAAPAPTPQAEERKPEAEKRPAEDAPKTASAEEAAPAPSPAPEVPRMAPPKRRKPPPPPTEEQLKEQAEREEKRKRAKMYHTLRAEELVDPMNEVNYIAVELPTKNMGVVFRPNPSVIGGIFVEALDAHGVAARHAGLKVGDQLVGIGDKLVKGQDIDACIDLIVPDARGLAKLTVFRGTASGLYGKGGAGGASDEWLAELMAKVADGRLEVTPAAPEPEPDPLPEPELEEGEEEAAQPAEKRRKNQRLSISDSESGGSDAEADDFSLDISEDSEAEASPPESRPALPERLASRLTGAGLEEDLESCAEALSQLPPDGASEHLPAEPRVLARLVVKACTTQNQEAWAELDEEAQASWQKAVRRRLAKAAGQRADRLEAVRRRQQQEQQCSELAAVAAAAASRQGGGKEDRAAAEPPLLQVQPDKVIKFDYNRTAQVTLRNPSQGHTAFRVRTSNPRSIFVQPCTGTLRPSEQVALQVCSSERPLGHSDLKFLIQAVPAPDAEAMPKEKWVELGTSAIKEWTLVGRL